MNLKEIEWKGVNWSSLTENRGEWTYLVNVVTNLQVLLNEKELLNFSPNETVH